MNSDYLVLWLAVSNFFESQADTIPEQFKAKEVLHRVFQQVSRPLELTDGATTGHTPPLQGS